MIIDANLTVVEYLLLLIKLYISCSMALLSRTGELQQQQIDSNKISSSSAIIVVLCATGPRPHHYNNMIIISRCIWHRGGSSSVIDHHHRIIIPRDCPSLLTESVAEVHPGGSMLLRAAPVALEYAAAESCHISRCR